MNIIEKACKMIGWNKEELYKEAKRLGWTPEFLANHLIKEERITKMVERLTI
ncbi:MAG: hypothetical protein ACFFDN_00120 [Candidatus Hodarchaeota archaeon]